VEHYDGVDPEVRGHKPVAQAVGRAHLPVELTWRGAPLSAAYGHSFYLWHPLLIRTREESRASGGHRTSGVGHTDPGRRKGSTHLCSDICFRLWLSLERPRATMPSALPPITPRTCGHQRRRTQSPHLHT
jgi:hypothetical protein